MGVSKMSEKRMESQKKRFYWKGKKVTEEVYKRRIQSEKIAANIRNIYGTRSEMHNLKSKLKKEVTCEYRECKGRRIVNVQTLGDGLICEKCNCILSLQDIVRENRCDLVSIWYVKCRLCLFISTLSTDKKHVLKKNRHYDINTKAVAGK